MTIQWYLIISPGGRTCNRENISTLERSMVGVKRLASSAAESFENERDIVDIFVMSYGDSGICALHGIGFEQKTSFRQGSRFR
jgi:hypothetical protein